MVKLRDYQREAVNSVFDYWAKEKGNPLIVAPCGCHEKGHPIIMADGSIKPVEQVVTGDFVMGVDSTPRLVTNLHRGRESMYKITPKKGESFIVNAGHILHLRIAPDHGRRAYYCDVSVREYLEFSKTKKRLSQIVRRPLIFSESNLPIDPYVLGFLIGDGCLLFGVVSFSNPDLEAIKMVEKWCNEIGCDVTIKWKEEKNCYTCNIVDSRSNSRNGVENKVRTLLKNLGLYEKRSGEKFIPQQYKTASYEQRINLIAGLIDTDGSLSRGGYDWISKSETLADDMVFLCRSVGLAAYKTECVKRCQNDFSGVYYRVSISGDCTVIPCVVPRRKTPTRKINKNVLRVGFSVEEVGTGDYYGFSLNKDRLYIDGFFNVHHNSGKSLIIGSLIKTVMSYANTRVLVLAHRKELLEQNEAELRNLWSDAPTGFYSAGIGRRDRGAQILFAGIQTIASKIHTLEPFDIVLIDETHLLPRSTSTQYGKTIETLKLMRPTCRFIGLTATPYRLDSGYLYQGDGSLFDKVSYEIPVQSLIDQGHLCEVVAKAGRQVADMSGVKKRMGEFNQTEMARAFEQDGLLVNACQQIIEEGADRKAWIVFCASVDQAEQVTEIMRSSGIDADLVTGAHSKGDREKTIERFKAGHLKCLVNVDVLTVGFNVRICDLAALIRATDSTSMYVQIVGRIMRTYPGKQNALLLDFGGNVERHGPIDDVVVKTPGKGDGEAPAKTCPDCLMIVAAGVRRCPECGHEFPPPEPKIEKRAFSGAVLKAQRVPDRLAVMFVKYILHSKPGKPMSVKITYTTGKKQVNEWLLPEHGGMAALKTAQVIMQRYNQKCPATSVELLAMLKQQKKPSFIAVEKDGKYERVTKVEFEIE